MSSTVTIEYRDNETKALIYSKDIYENVKTGLYIYKAKDINRYTPIKGTIFLFVIFFIKNYTITFYYNKKDIPEPVYGCIEINYINIDTNEKLISSINIENIHMGEYSFEAKSIEGYDLITDSKVKVVLTIENPNVVIDFKYRKKESTEYVIDLKYFNIKNDGTSPIETSKGINKALEFISSSLKYKKIIFPKGIYLIDENNPIVIKLKDITIDLNGSTLKINSNALEKYSIVSFEDGAENLIFTNGILEGDKETHDYITVPGTHEWGCGLVVNGGYDCIIDNISVINVPGYGVATNSGNNKNRYDTVYVKDFQIGDINLKGEIIESNIVSRTKAYNISACNGKFEFGYTLGYQGYPYIKQPQYISYFYDKNNQFISSEKCLQFRKVIIPDGAVYVRFVFPQIDIASNLGYVGWISNFEPPTNIILRNCTISNNRSLGIAFCGGQQWTIENNIFENNGGQAPGYAIDFEDGWDLMQDIKVENNKFMGNKSGDIVTCAGDNIIFEGNEFTGMVYMWGRTTNYKFVKNIFKSNSVTYEYSSKIESKENQFVNSNLRLQPRNTTVTERPYVYGETFTNSSIDRMTEEDIILNSIVTSDGTINVRIVGNLKDCSLKMKQCYLSAELNSCIIEDSILTVLLNASMNECIISKSIVRTHGNTGTIIFNKCKMVDCNILTQTWGSSTVLEIENNIIEMSSSSDDLIKLSAGKMKNLIFNNNEVNNSSSKSVFNLFDTTYSNPNGKVTLRENVFNQNLSPYIFSGTTIKKGLFEFYDIRNTINGNAKILNPLYLNNEYFVIYTE